MDRVERAVRYGTLFAVGWGVVFFALAAGLSGGIARVFNDSQAVQTVIIQFLLIVPISYAGQGVLLVSTASLNALNKPLHATALMALRLFVLYIPLAFIGMRVADVTGIFAAAALANFGAGIAGALWLRRVLGVKRDEDAAPLQATAPAPAGD
jgi:Na+-driven multidrug efflux pump